MVFGTFDYLHPGHLDFFKQAKKLGDYLVVVVATDHNVQKAKGKLPQIIQETRLKAVSELKEVDKAMLGSEEMDYLTTIKVANPQIIALGYDQDFSQELLQKELKEAHLATQVVRLKAYQPEKYKSSLLKKYLRTN